MKDYRYGLPWSQERGERKRLLAVALVVAPLFVIFAEYVNWVQLPEQDRQEREALPPQLAKLVVEKKEPPKPVEQAKPEPKPEPKPQPPVLKPKPEAKKKPKPKPEAVAKARKKAKNTGILAMGNELSKLSALANTVKLDAPVTRTAKLVTRKAEDALAARATANVRSSGVNDAALERESRHCKAALRPNSSSNPVALCPAALWLSQRLVSLVWRTKSVTASDLWISAPGLG
ncbi:hypothetical protein SAMN04488490_0569 [Marinobacter sp. LV10R510-11A]|nr:hypothetical protein SAMN04488490_0569 [Marinobacter sp. LV10R510-11A]